MTDTILGFIFGVIAAITVLTVLVMMTDRGPRPSERKWYILEGREWYEYENADIVDKFYSEYLRTQRATFQKGDVSYFFNSSRYSWKLWVLKSSVWHKLMFQNM